MGRQCALGTLTFYSLSMQEELTCTLFSDFNSDDVIKNHIMGAKSRLTESMGSKQTTSPTSAISPKDRRTQYQPEVDSLIIGHLKQALTEMEDLHTFLSLLNSKTTFSTQEIGITNEELVENDRDDALLLGMKVDHIERAVSGMRRISSQISKQYERSTRFMKDILELTRELRLRKVKGKLELGDCFSWIKGRPPGFGEFDKTRIVVKSEIFPHEDSGEAYLEYPANFRFSSLTLTLAPSIGELVIKDSEEVQIEVEDGSSERVLLVCGVSGISELVKRFQEHFLDFELHKMVYSDLFRVKGVAPLLVNERYSVLQVKNDVFMKVEFCPKNFSAGNPHDDTDVVAMDTSDDSNGNQSYFIISPEEMKKFLRKRQIVMLKHRESGVATLIPLIRLIKHLHLVQRTKQLMKELRNLYPGLMRVEWNRSEDEVGKPPKDGALGEDRLDVELEETFEIIIGQGGDLQIIIREDSFSIPSMIQQAAPPTPILDLNTKTSVKFGRFTQIYGILRSGNTSISTFHDFEDEILIHIANEVIFSISLRLETENHMTPKFFRLKGYLAVELDGRFLVSVDRFQLHNLVLSIMMMPEARRPIGEFNDITFIESPWEKKLFNYTEDSEDNLDRLLRFVSFVESEFQVDLSPNLS